MDLVPIEFAVVARDGHPVLDLTEQEITVRLAGRARKIRSLQLIRSAVDGRDPARLSLSPPFGTNASAAEGRAFVLIIDDDSFRAGREGPLREAAQAFARDLSPRDRLALVTMPYGGVKVPLTTDHSRVVTALQRLVGQSTGVETGSELACRTRRTLETLAGHLDTYGIRSPPLTVLFITGGLAAPRRDAPITLGPGMCELRIEVFEEVARAAGRARAMFYVIQPVEMLPRPGALQTENVAGAGFRGSDNPMEGIEHLVGVTGGKMLNLTGSPESALGRILRETAAYYRAAVEPHRQDRTGRSHELQVRVTRAGAEVRSPPHITFARAETARGHSLNPSPRDMLSTTAVFRDLPLRASAYTALDADGKTMRVVTIAEPVEPTTRLASLLAALFDREGKLVSHWTATQEELQRSPVLGAMPAGPGAYRLRVAAIDTEGRSGTADYEMEAEVVRTGPLTLSSLILGLSREGRFVPKLQFTTEPVAIAYLEMHGAAPGTRISAAVELATSTNGPAVVSVPLAIEASGELRYIAKGAVAIGALPPGDYVVRALVGIEGQALTRVVRTLRKAAAAR